MTTEAEIRDDERTRPRQLNPDEIVWLRKRLREKKFSQKWITAIEYYPLQDKPTKAILYGMIIALQN